MPRRDPVTKKLVRDEDGETIIDTIPASFGALNVIYGTTISSVIALAFAGGAEPRVVGILGYDLVVVPMSHYNG